MTFNPSHFIFFNVVVKNSVQIAQSKHILQDAFLQPKSPHHYLDSQNITPEFLQETLQKIMASS